MVLLAVMLLSYLALLWATNRTRSPAFFLIIGFAVGAFFLSSIGFGLDSFGASLWVLLGLISFEFFMLLLFSDEIRLSRTDLHASGTAVNHLHVTALSIYALACTPFLVSYMLGVVVDVSNAGDVSAYFLDKRAAAHAGQGIDKTNPYVYRIINSGLPLLILYFILCDHSVVAGKTKLCMAGFFALVGLTSLMEGNRSTLVVTVVALFVVYFLSAKRKFITLSIFSALFVVLFAISMALFRFDDGLTWESFIKGIYYFVIYAFGSLLAFEGFYDYDIGMYWGAYDALVIKFFPENYEAYGAKSLLFIDYVDVFYGIQTNVYSSYAVLLSYLGKWLWVFILMKVMVFRAVMLLQKKNTFFMAVSAIFAACLCLSIYHEFFITGLYLCFSMGVSYAPFYVIAFLLERYSDPNASTRARTHV